MYLIEGLTVTEIGKRLGITAAGVNYWMSKFNLCGQRHVKFLLFEPSPALSYVLGVILGDGCVNKRKNGGYTIRLNVKDREFANSFSKAMRLIGFNTGKLLHIRSKNPKWSDTWLSCSYSKEFGEWYNGMTLKEKINLAMKFPCDFTRGVYESEGSIVRHHGNLDLSITNTKEKGCEIIMAIKNNLPDGIKSSVSTRKNKYGKVYTLSITKNIDIRRFLAWTMPCIKTVPRSELISCAEETQANTEPIHYGNVVEGVENTKADLKGGRVGRVQAIDHVQRSGRCQPVRDIPTHMETCGDEQKCLVP